MFLLVVLSVACLKPTPDDSDPSDSSDSSDDTGETTLGQIEALAPQDCATVAASNALPGDVDQDVWPFADTDKAQLEFDQFSWETFLSVNAPSDQAPVNPSGDNPTRWEIQDTEYRGWSSTADFLNCLNEDSGGYCVTTANTGQADLCQDQECGSGSHYYPYACATVEGPEGESFWSYRVLGQVGKVDDDFLVATNAGESETDLPLSNSPVIDANGRFIRFEILINPTQYDWAKDNGLWDQAAITAAGDLNQECSSSDGDEGPITVKAAWMELTDDMDASAYHTEDMLVYTPEYRIYDADTSSSAADDVCELKTMALVGMHIARKTANHPEWTWSTFEHDANAPDCTDPFMPVGAQSGTQNTSCPTTGGDYNISAIDGAACNTAPDSNVPAGSATDTCKNPEHTEDAGWCVLQVSDGAYSPADVVNQTQACRQVPLDPATWNAYYDANGWTFSEVVAPSYESARSWNEGCATALTDSVWGRYELISTQWDNWETAPECVNSQESTSNKRTFPQGYEHADATSHEVSAKPFLANTTMETYERSNCKGCHAKSQQEPGGGNKTDFSWWIGVEANSEVPD